MARGDGGDRARAALRMRLGHIPAGSTDAVAYSLNGTRAVETAALHIALGDR
jgi:ceramide kinase